ncbi:class I adenylate-forming enzyme family protein [Aspergillus stella-maris]|uniref:class I adenylate-forming enzyme family protein n=1 Tax=Aspergillus stella-maris TaxID=1810926 RepID=UPI003CCE2A01
MTRTYIQVPERPWLTQFYQHCQRDPSARFIRDLESDKEATWAEFLLEVLVHRERLKHQLDSETLQRLQDPNDEVFIAIIAAGGFDYAVLLFAIVTLGAVVVPLRPQVHPEEARYFLETCNAALVTSSQQAAPHAESLCASLNIPHFAITPSHTDISTLTFELIPQSSEFDIPPYDPTRGFSLLYTSGTTGPSKGVLSSSGAILAGTENYKERLALCHDDTWLHQMPAHWKGGFDFVLAAAHTGATVEFCSGVFSPCWFWERMRRGCTEDEGIEPITCFLGAPMTLSALKEGLDSIATDEERNASLRGLNCIRVLLTGSVRVPDEVKNVWRGLRGGRELVNMYGFTEVAGMISMTDWDAVGAVSTDNCGRHNPAVKVKVNDDGEICVKGPLLMKRYISSDPNVMQNVHDAEGFYKSGDMGSITPAGEIVVSGRANQDVIRFNGYKVHSGPLEDALRSHPHITQAFVLGVPDSLYGERITAILLQKNTPDGEIIQDMTLASLRYWLAVENNPQQPAFKLPGLLKVIPSSEFRGLTDSGKPSKKKIREIYFSEEELEKSDVQVWDFETEEHYPGDRAWDWEGRPPR